MSQVRACSSTLATASGRALLTQPTGTRWSVLPISSDARGNSRRRAVYDKVRAIEAGPTRPSQRQGDIHTSW